MSAVAVSADVIPLPLPAGAKPDRILRRDEVEILTGLSCSTIYRHIHAGKFPAPIELGSNAVGWRESVITRWCATRPVRPAFR